MTPVVLRKPRVDEDLIEHFAFIAEDKIAPADRFLEVAEESFQRLAFMPSIGVKWESTRVYLADIRYYPLPPPYRSYLVFYRPIANGVEILTVLHGARDLETTLPEILKPKKPER
ncbi:MAG TPA: type II toxin-antitoxin system RelE/ParE family toxin [Phycisphaerae bacterium]|nr:type II toxin-antitoxin system RelE/ParE family toxin [Phycisphaerae bacterium]